MKEQILERLPEGIGWQVHWFDTIGSTNTTAKEMARNGAPHGTVLIAGHQSAGRGRMGRSFCSDAGMGVYLSLILRPNCKPDQLMHLTCAAGVAMYQAIRKVCGLEIGLKWVNDLVWNKKKLGGILTEMILSPTGLVECAVVGIGINCRQKANDFPGELQDIALSLEMATGKTVAPADLAAAMIQSLFEMDQHLLSDQDRFMENYRTLCVTLGQSVRIVGEDTQGKAVDVTSDGALVIETMDGQLRQVNSGEVSVRGMYGYI